MNRKIHILALTVLMVFATGCDGQTKENDTTNPHAMEQNELSTNGWHEIAATEIEGNPSKMFGEQWGLLTAGTEDDLNTMTIAWGTLGMLWSKPVMNVYVSTDRHTFGYMQKNDHYTVTFFSEEYRDTLMYLGTHSGRDGDKIAASGLHVEMMPDGQPGFSEATMVVSCKKIYAAQFDTAAMDESPRQIYTRTGMGVHYAYVGEIEHVWVRGR